MPQQTTTQAQGHLNQKLKAVAEDVLQVIQLAATKVALNHAQPNNYTIAKDQNTFESILQARFERVSSLKKDAIAADMVTQLQAAPKAGRQRVADVRSVDFRLITPIESQVTLSPKLRGLTLTLDELTKMDKVDTLSPVASAANPLQKLELRIHRVKCIDETGGWLEIGSDEIRLGGTAVDETGDTHKIGDFGVMNFDDGDVKTYSPPKSFTTFRLTEGNQFPKQYLVTLILAEQDQGGVSDFINNLLKKIKEEIAKRLAKLIGQAYPPIEIFNEEIRKAIKWVLDNVIDYILRLWSDDIFRPVTVRTRIPSLTARWNGNAQSPRRKVLFTGHKGKYELTYDWRMFS
jgi:hypothetical protein